MVEVHGLPRARIVVARALVVVGSCCALAVTAGAATLVESGPPVAGELRSCGTRGDSSAPQQLPTPAGRADQASPAAHAVRERGCRRPRAAMALLDRGSPWSSTTRSQGRARGTHARAVGARPVRSRVARRPGVWVSSVRLEACREDGGRVPRAASAAPSAGTRGSPFGLALARRPACVPIGRSGSSGSGHPVCERLVPVRRAARAPRRRRGSSRRRALPRRECRDLVQPSARATRPARASSALIGPRSGCGAAA